MITSKRKYYFQLSVENFHLRFPYFKGLCLLFNKLKFKKSKILLHSVFTKSINSTRKKIVYQKKYLLVIIKL